MYTVKENMQKPTSKNINTTYRAHLREPKEDSLPLAALTIGALLLVFTSLFTMNVLLQIVWKDSPLFVL